MMKLHAQDIYKRILCVLLKIGKVWHCCCWIVEEFMVNWFCCCCYEMLLLMLDAMGIHNHRVVVWIWVVFESFMKNGWNGDLWWNDVLIQVLYGFECLFMFINV